MGEHISPAMRNSEAIKNFLNFNAPSDLQNWTFLVIEAVMVIGLVLTVRHALRRDRQSGNHSAIFTLLAAFGYGLLIDIASYYTVENFWHGEFSVMFLYNRLPLYVVLFYPVVIYTITMTIRRFTFSRAVETISTAFYAGLVYMIFDNLGPMVGWWVWDRTDPTTLPYLNAVPVTSYYWWFAWTGAFALFARIICWDWVEQGKSARTVGVGVASIPVLTCVAGVALFVPFNLFADNGYHGLAAAFYAVVFSISGLVFVLHFRQPTVPRDRSLLAFPLIYVAGHLFVYVATFDTYFTVDGGGLSRDGLAVGNLPVAMLAMIATVAITLASQPVAGGEGPRAITHASAT